MITHHPNNQKGIKTDFYRILEIRLLHDISNLNMSKRYFAIIQGGKGLLTI